MWFIITNKNKIKDVMNSCGPCFKFIAPLETSKNNEIVTQIMRENQMAKPHFNGIRRLAPLQRS